RRGAHPVARPLPDLGHGSRTGATHGRHPLRRGLHGARPRRRGGSPSFSAQPRRLLCLRPRGPQGRAPAHARSRFPQDRCVARHAVRAVIMPAMRPSAMAALLLAASCATPPPPKYTIQLPERHATLPNGMRVVLLPDPTTDLVEVDV